MKTGTIKQLYRMLGKRSDRIAFLVGRIAMLESTIRELRHNGDGQYSTASDWAKKNIESLQAELKHRDAGRI
jgi:hypothetical protein